MLAVWVNWISTSETRNCYYDVIVGGELFTDYPITLANLSRQTQNSNQQAPDAASASFPLVGCLPQAVYLKDFPKSQDAVALQQIKERGALPMIDRGDIRQAIDRCSNIWASLPGAGYGRLSIKGWTARLQKFSKGGGTAGEIDVWADPAIISALLSASSSACRGC